MRLITREELARNDGRNGNPAYFAYEGYVYDASDSFLWKNGRHQVLHSAGVDLTGELEDAPHGADLLERTPLIGKLVKD